MRRPITHHTILADHQIPNLVKRKTLNVGVFRVILDALKVDLAAIRDESILGEGRAPRFTALGILVGETCANGYVATLNLTSQGIRIVETCECRAFGESRRDFCCEELGLCVHYRYTYTSVCLWGQWFFGFYF